VLIQSLCVRRVSPLSLVYSPPRSRWAHVSMQLQIEFPSAYPAAPPSVRFVTPIFHPNGQPASQRITYKHNNYRTSLTQHASVVVAVNAQDGSICASVLSGSDWSPSYTLESLLLNLQSLLVDPNVDSPLNAEAASLYSEQESDAEPYWARVDAIHQHNMATARAEHAPSPAELDTSACCKAQERSASVSASIDLSSSPPSSPPTMSLLVCARRWAASAGRGTFGAPYQLHADQQDKLLEAVRARVVRDSTASSSALPHSSHHSASPLLSRSDEMRMRSVLLLVITSPHYFAQLYAVLPRPRARPGAAAAGSHTSQVRATPITSCALRPERVIARARLLTIARLYHCSRSRVW
jgi:ubiquitin-protein ligase